MFLEQHIRFDFCHVDTVVLMLAKFSFAITEISYIKQNKNRKLILCFKNLKKKLKHLNVCVHLL